MRHELHESDKGLQDGSAMEIRPTIALLRRR
jgi:hypothetical protein